ncbi:MAG: HAMP domain-containing histidine kinase [Candidatus Obscuribacterales bacterium]|nr:HAMP domain-containing histidine kinase [Candidatus Obscuribacterales bacterium]
MTKGGSKKLRVLPGNLAQKGLLIIGLPITLELVFLGLITFENKKLESQANREAHYRRLLAECALMSFSSAGIFQHLQNALAGYSGEDLEAVDRDLNLLDQTLERVKAEALKDSESSQASAKMLATAATLRTTFSRARSLLSGKLEIDSACELFELKTSLLELVPRFLHEQQDLCINAMNLSNKANKLQVQTRAKERNWIIAAAITSALIAVWVGYIFSKEIRSRLAIIKDNTVLLKKNEALNPPVGGADEIRSLDEAFREMADALREAKAKERELYAMIAHDIRSPLLAAKITVGLAQKQEELPAKTNEYLRRACRGLEQISNLISDLLDIEKLSAGKFEIFPERLNSVELVEASRDAAQGLFEEKGIIVELSMENYEFMGDRDLLKRVIANLLSNAVKFSPEKAQIDIQVKKHEQMPRFSIKDRGPGIDAESQKKLFKHFSQTSEARNSKTRSSGLGLSICKMVVEEHDGKIGVNSEPGKGSEFWFSLPLPIN